MRRGCRVLQVVVGLLVVVGLMAPVGLALPEEFFIFQPDPETTVLEEGDGLRVCAVMPLFGFSGMPQGSINLTKPSGVTVPQDPDDEDCASFLLNETGRYTAIYPEADDMGMSVQEREATLVVGSDVEAVNNSATATVQGFESFDERLVELSLLVLAVVAFSQGWIFAGAFAWLAAIGTQMTNPGTLTYTFGYAGFAMFLGLELVGHKFGPIRKARGFFSR